MRFPIDTVWLTVNRFCNFRCYWCYAKNTRYLKTDDLNYQLAQDLIIFSKSLGIKNIILIGGEPTYYPHLFELIKYIKKHDLRLALVTNGYKFKDVEFVKKIEKSGLDTINFSIKAANAEQQKKLTKVDVFIDIKHAIENLSTINGVSVQYSVVLSKDTIYNVEEFAQIIANLDDKKHLQYSLCRPIFDSKGNVNKDFVVQPQILIDILVKKFEQISRILKNKVSLIQSLPMCIWPQDFIKKLENRNQIQFGCHLKNRQGLIFDNMGKVLVCNSLPLFTIGQYGIDFIDKNSFESFWMNKDLERLYNKFFEYPTIKCKTCRNYLDCGGGCPLMWLAYDVKKVLKSG